MNSHVAEKRHDEMERDRALIVGRSHSFSPLGGGTSSVAEAGSAASGPGEGDASISEEAA